MHNHDAVFWGVIISVIGSALVLAWLAFVVVRNAMKKKD